MNGWVVLLWAFVSALVLIVIGIFVALVLMGRISLSPDAEPKAPPAQGIEGVVDTTYSVLVLNATPEEGLDVQMRDTLLNAGWAADTVIYGPAESQDFANTTVYYVADEDEQAAVGLADVIDGAEVAQSDTVTTTSDERQLVIVIGLDRSSASSDSADTPAD